MEIGTESLDLHRSKDEKFFELVDKENIPSYLKDSLRKIIKEEELLSFKIETNFIESTGGNYTGELYVAQLRGNTEKGYKEINLFIKSIVPSGSDLGFVSLEDVYLREIFVYSKLRKVLDELQIKAAIPGSERFKMVKFYNTTHESLLIMENLSVKGFKVPERLAIPSLRFCEIAMEQLGRFHSLSFVIKKENPEFFKKEIASLKFLIQGNDMWSAVLNNSAKNAIGALHTDEAKEKLSKYVSSINLQDNFRYHLCNEDMNIGVLCHGDYRTQNILMRQKDCETVEIMPLDYQLAYYGHPVNDLIYFIVGATDREFRKNHLDHLKTLYYDSMKKHLLYFHMQLEDLYPREQFEEDFKKKLDFAIVLAVHFLPLFFAPEDDFADLSMDLTTTKLPQSDMYVRCLNELVADLIHWGIL